MSELESLATALRQYEATKQIDVALAFLYAYHCVLTMDEEVKYVLSRKFSLGKGIYLAARYLPIPRASMTVLMYLYSPNGFGAHCPRLHMAISVLSFSASAASNAALVLCVYALLGAHKRSMIILSSSYLVFCIPALALICLYNAKSLTFIERSPLDALIGMTCVVSYSGTRSYPIAVVAVYLAGSLGMTGLTITVLLMRYKNQSNSLLKSIRRDGGLFYGATLLIRLVYATTTLLIWTLPLPAIFYNIGGIFERLDGTLGPMLSTALILNLRKLDDPTSRSVISALVFVVDRDLAHAEALDSEEGSVEGVHRPGLPTVVGKEYAFRLRA